MCEFVIENVGDSEIYAIYRNNLESYKNFKADVCWWDGLHGMCGKATKILREEMKAKEEL